MNGLNESAVHVSLRVVLQGSHEFATRLPKIVSLNSLRRSCSRNPLRRATRKINDFRWHD